MRYSYLISYDVSDAKRLRQMHKLMMGYAKPMHYSVFIGHLLASERRALEEKIKSIISLNEDRVFFARLSRSQQLSKNAIVFFGRPFRADLEFPKFMII